MQNSQSVPRFGVGGKSKEEKGAESNADKQERKQKKEVCRFQVKIRLYQTKHAATSIRTTSNLIATAAAAATGWPWPVPAART